MRRRKGGDPEISEQCGSEPSDVERGQGDGGMQLRVMEDIGNKVE
jgi:hypothetical protein